jgi:hypothetical protein
MLDYIWQMILKKFLQLRRDKHARFWLIVTTIAQMLVFGYATPRQVPCCSTETPCSGELIPCFAFQNSLFRRAGNSDKSPREA